MKQGMSLVMAMCCAALIAGCMCPKCPHGGKGRGCPSGACRMKKSGDTMNPGVVNTAALMALKRAQPDLILLDARTGKFDDGNRIPGAQALAPDAPEVDVTAMLPDKQALIVTYCANLECPASQTLGERLRKLGYVNVIEYCEGIEGWKAAGNPVANIAK